MQPTAPWQTPEVQKAIRRFVLLALLLLVPVFVIALFDRPSADDYYFGAAARAVVASGGGIGELLRASWDFAKSGAGTYVSTFLSTFQPGIWGNRWYALVPLSIMGVLFLCLWGAARLVLGRLLPGSRGLPLAAALLLTFAFVQGMPNQVEGLFWFDGAVVYQPFFALAVLNAALAFAIVWDGGAPRWRSAAYLLANCVCSFLAVGGHLVVGLLNCMMLAIAALLAVLCRPAPGRRRNFRLLPGLLVSVAGLLLNVLAPSVQDRAAGFQFASFPEAVVKSFVLAALELVRWLDVPLLCFLFLLTPLCLWVARHNGAGLPLFRHFWLAPAVTFVLMWGMIFLPSWSMGGIGPGRLINVVWMTFMLGTAVSYTALLGWLVQVRGVDPAPALRLAQRHKKGLYITACAALLCIACIGGRTVKEGLDNRYATSLEAVWELGQGYPQRFAAVLDAREAALTAPGTQPVTIHPLTEQEIPAMLFFSDISPDFSWNIGGYYGREVIVE